MLKRINLRPFNNNVTIRL